MYTHTLNVEEGIIELQENKNRQTETETASV